MLLASLTCALALQQLQIEPTVAYVGENVVVTARHAGEPLADTRVELESPDGTQAVIGVTGGDGTLYYTMKQAGRYVFRAEVGGVRCVSPIVCHDVRRRWMLALASVPLGIALLFVQWRRRARGTGQPA